MRHLGFAKTIFSISLLSLLFISACGRRAAAPIDYNRQSINDPILGPSLTPGNPVTPGTGSGQAAYAIGSYSGISPTVGSTVTLILFDQAQSSTVSGATPIAANFFFEGNPSGVQFVGASQGVTQVQITSSQATNVTVKAIPVALATQSNPSYARLTLSFVAGSGFTNLNCNIEGPYNYSALTYPSTNYQAVTGNYTYFRVTSPQVYGSLEILTAGTYDSSEQANYADNYSRDAFVIWFTNPGSKTVMVTARASNGAICNAQLTFRVVTPYVAPTQSLCGLNWEPPRQDQITCMAVGWSNTYYVNNGRCEIQQIPICTPGGYYRGSFDTLEACQSALQSRLCGYYQPPQQARWCPVTSRQVGVSGKNCGRNNCNRFEEATLSDGIVLPSDAYGISMTLTSVTVDDWSPEIRINGTTAFQSNDSRQAPRTISTAQPIGYLLRGGNNTVYVKSYNTHTYWSTYFTVSGGYWTYGSCSDSFRLQTY